MQTKTIVLTKTVKDGDSNAMRAFSKTMTEAAKRTGATVESDGWLSRGKVRETVVPIVNTTPPPVMKAPKVKKAKKPKWEAVKAGWEATRAAGTYTCKCGTVFAALGTPEKGGALYHRRWTDATGVYGKNTKHYIPTIK